MNLDQIIEEIRGLDPENPGAWPTWAHIGAAVLLGLALLLLAFWFLIRPQTAQLEGLRDKEPQLRAEFESKQRKVAGLDAYKAQLAEMERSFGAMLKQLPSRGEVENLLNDISQARIASGLDEQLFQPEGQVSKEFYAELPNRIVLVGKFHDMGRFVSSVAALPRIVTIDEVKLEPADPKAPSTQLRLTALAKTYRYLDENDLPSATKEAAKTGKGQGKPKGGAS